ncbi:hypothetical protein H310_09059 [Aphanomyces invadans]|uniref:TBC1 domain family member 31 n=1 Tax=Aphanomyces invadans TaxID=157072 RepID=A0A024TWH7_9STRA|nr:hypothetical protein H310_09059 [Aphanomyces invadans]ETV98368.1 hypothetical protein H310_09059 [Aphanomyces invadans]|eukprot:XP_008873243.1 hypothetical protein H310_09059 [Aphanomyces invadans]
MVYEVRLKLSADGEGVLWPRRPQVGPLGLLGSFRNLPLRAFKNSSAGNGAHDLIEPPSSSAACPVGNARFRCVAFSVGGDIFSAVDEKGRVFAFFPLRNRYALVCHLGTPALECAFSPVQRTELLVTCEDMTVRCVNVQTKALVSTLRGHRQVPTSVSFQLPGQLALTASADAVIMWNSANWSRFRTLNAGPGVEAAQFAGNGELVAVCFRDDSILMWELSTLALQYRFTLPAYEHPPGLKRFSVSENCHVIVASGQSPFIYVWEFESQTLVRIIELPATVHRIVQHAFVPTTAHIMGVLGDDGQLNFLNVTSKQPKVSLQIAHKVKALTAFAIEGHGKYLAACSSDGCLVLYDLDIARETAHKVQDIRQRADAEDLSYLPHRSGLAHRHQHPTSTLMESLFGAPYQPPPTVPMQPPAPPQADTDASKIDGATEAPPPVSSTPSRRKAPLQPSLNLHEYTVQHRRLQQLLRSYGRFPEKYRLLAWKYILRLPINTAAFEQLVAKGNHSTTTRLHDLYPIQNQRLFRRLKRILSALAHWCPVYGELTTVPALAFPFVKVCVNDDVVAFEVVLSVLVHWGRDFVLQYPYPPRPQLTRLDQALQQRDAQLHAHFMSHRITPEDYGWSLVSTAFSEVLARHDWLCLWDNLIAHWDKPSLLWTAVLAYLSQIRNSLLQSTTASAIQASFHHQQPLQVKQWIVTMHAIQLPKLVDADDSNDDVWFPLPPGQYPAFTRYPTFVVDYQIQERNRIATEEAALESKRQLLSQIEARTRELEAAHATWMDDKVHILESEQRRRMQAMQAEKARLMELNILHAQTRDRRLQQIALMEQRAKEALRETTKILQAEHDRWLDELNVHSEKEKMRSQQQMDEEELTRLEFDAHRRVAELTKDREREERLQQMRLEFFAQLREQDLHDQMVFDGWKDEDNREIAAQNEARERLAAKQLRREEAKLRYEWRTKFNEQRMQKQRQMQMLAQERARRRASAPIVAEDNDDDDVDGSDVEFKSRDSEVHGPSSDQPRPTASSTPSPNDMNTEKQRDPSAPLHQRNTRRNASLGNPSDPTPSAPVASESTPWQTGRIETQPPADCSPTVAAKPDFSRLQGNETVSQRPRRTPSSSSSVGSSRASSFKWNDHEILQRALDDISSDEDDVVVSPSPFRKETTTPQISQLEHDLRAEFSDLSNDDRESLEQRPLSELERDLDDLLGDVSDDDERNDAGKDAAPSVASTTGDLNSLLEHVREPPLVVQATNTTASTPPPTRTTTEKDSRRTDTTRKLQQLRSKLSDLEAMASKAIPVEVEEKFEAGASRNKGEHAKLMERAKELLEQHAARLKG